MKPRPIVADLGSVGSPRTERRDTASRHAIARRIRGEFEEMPGLTLSLEQGSRLFGLPLPVCARVFGALVVERVLRVTSGGRYALAK